MTLVIIIMLYNKIILVILISSCLIKILTNKNINIKINKHTRIINHWTINAFNIKINNFNSYDASSHVLNFNSKRHYCGQ